MTTPTPELEDLAARCESATGPNFALDHDIVAALDIEHQNRWAVAANAGVEPNPYPLPAYTASLDAAMSLVPSGYMFTLFSDGCAGVAKCEGEELPDGDTHAAAPALALCAAALRAIAKERG